MVRTALSIAAVFLTLGLSPAQSADATVGAMKISAPWARATPKGAAVGGGYMAITNTGTTADRLIAGATNVSDKLEMHEMSMDNGVMKMRPLSQGIEIKPGETVTLQPGGLHLMFVGLKAPLKQGDTIKVTLQFDKAGKVEVDYPVAGIGASAPGGGAKHDAHGAGSMGGMKH